MVQQLSHGIEYIESTGLSQTAAAVVRRVRGLDFKCSAVVSRGSRTYVEFVYLSAYLPINVPEPGTSERRFLCFPPFNFRPGGTL